MRSMSAKKMNVLMIESSVVWQSVLENTLRKEPYLHLIGVTANSHDALEIATANLPDMLIIDAEMTDVPMAETIEMLHGIVKNSSAQRTLHVIVLSAKGGVSLHESSPDKRIIAIIPKSGNNQPAELVNYIKQKVIPEIRKVALEKHLISTIGIKENTDGEHTLTELIHLRAGKPRRIRAIFIGVSTGGPAALGRFLPVLCEKTDLPILIVQHMPRSFSTSLMDNLKPVCSFDVKEARDNMPIVEKTIYIAPGDQHMITRRTPQGLPFIALSSTPPEGGGFRPSVDVLFKSVAATYGNEAIAIILTGMGEDGAKGVVSLKEKGAYIIVQDEKSSVVWGMPKAVIDAGCQDVILPLDEIPHAIGNYLRQLKQSA